LGLVVALHLRGGDETGGRTTARPEKKAARDPLVLSFGVEVFPEAGTSHFRKPLMRIATQVMMKQLDHVLSRKSSNT